MAENNTGLEEIEITDGMFDITEFTESFRHRLKIMYEKKQHEIRLSVTGKDIDVSREYSRKEFRAKEAASTKEYGIFNKAARAADMTPEELVTLIISLAEQKRAREDELILWLGDQRIAITALINDGADDKDIEKALQELDDTVLEDI